MTGKADFDEQQWDTVLEGPTSAGLIVMSAERGGTFREAFAMAKVYGEARSEHGERSNQARLTTLGFRSSALGIHEFGSAASCSPLRMSLTSPPTVPPNHTNGMRRRSA